MTTYAYTRNCEVRARVHRIVDAVKFAAFVLALTAILGAALGGGETGLLIGAFLSMWMLDRLMFGYFA